MDFNSLRVLNAVIECGSVTKSAKKLFVSPSSISYSLNKLRNSTSNNLVIRRNGRMEPTQIAIELNNAFMRVNEILQDCVNSGNNSPEPVNTRCLTINTHSFFEFILLSLFTKEYDFFSKIRLDFVNKMKTTEERTELIRCELVEVDIGSKLPNDFSIVSEKIISSGYKIMVSETHPTIKNRLTITDWRENKRIKWTAGYNDSIIDVGDAGLTKELCSEDNIVINSGSSLSSIMACAKSNYLLLVPGFLEPYLSKLIQVNFFPLPFNTTLSASLYLNYHKKMKGNAKVKAFISAIEDMLIS